MRIYSLFGFVLLSRNILFAVDDSSRLGAESGNFGATKYSLFFPVVFVILAVRLAFVPSFPLSPINHLHSNIEYSMYFIFDGREFVDTYPRHCMCSAIQ